MSGLSFLLTVVRLPFSVVTHHLHLQYTNSTVTISMSAQNVLYGGYVRIAIVENGDCP